MYIYSFNVFFIIMLVEAYLFFFGFEQLQKFIILRLLLPTLGYA